MAGVTDKLALQNTKEINRTSRPDENPEVEIHMEKPKHEAINTEKSVFDHKNIEGINSKPSIFDRTAVFHVTK